jgi:hypothetical protein
MKAKKWKNKKNKKAKNNNNDKETDNNSSNVKMEYSNKQILKHLGLQDIRM